MSCPPQKCELCLWAIILIVLLAVLSISALLILAVFIIWKFCFSQGNFYINIATVTVRSKIPPGSYHKV